MVVKGAGHMDDHVFSHAHEGLGPEMPGGGRVRQTRSWRYIHVVNE